jgi:thiosulfate/3-mercaptopyruvate sulfurtransferase
MLKTLSRWLLPAIVSCLLAAQHVATADESKGNLVSARWLAQNLTHEEVLVLDASPGLVFAAKHIPGAVNVDWFSFGIQAFTPAAMEQRLQSWGVSAGKKIVIYDRGGDIMATRLFFDLYYHGVPATDIFILDGGLSKWEETGGPVTKDPTSPPKKGTFRVTVLNADARVRLPEFLNASGDPANNALIEALEPDYHFGERKFFDRAGHVPHGIMFPTADFYNPDKTFKSAEEIRRMVSHLGVTPDQQIHTYCGGGLAASVPFFALRFLLGYPKVKLYVESQLEWLQDDRGLPFWTYDAPFLMRDKNWLHGWSNRMLRSYGLTQVSVIDVRTAEAYKRDHVPFALSIPEEAFRSNVPHPARLAEVLGPAGVNVAHEAVIISDGGLNPGSALAFLMLEKAGQKKVSILMDSVDEWGLHGLPLTKEATVVGPRKAGPDLSIPPTVYPANPRAGVMMRAPGEGEARYPKVFLASGTTVPDRAQGGKVVHVPYRELLNANGTPKAAADIWKILTKAGLPRYAEIICYSQDPGEAAVNYFILKLMGFPDVKVLVI